MGTIFSASNACKSRAMMKVLATLLLLGCVAGSASDLAKAKQAEEKSKRQMHKHRQQRIIDQAKAETFAGRRTYGFASICELEVAKYYCAIAPHDAFCARDILSKCLEIKEKCLDFESTNCTPEQECCQCAFTDCPLEREGCELMAEKCINDKVVP